MAHLRAFLDANVLFTAAYSPYGPSAVLIEIGRTRRFTLLTSLLAVIEARRNLELKRPAAIKQFEILLDAVEFAAQPGPAGVARLTPADLAAKDRPLLAAAIANGATHFVTGDRRHFGKWMGRPGSLPLNVLTPREFLMQLAPRTLIAPSATSPRK